MESWVRGLYTNYMDMFVWIYVYTFTWYSPRYTKLTLKKYFICRNWYFIIFLLSALDVIFLLLHLKLHIYLFSLVIINNLNIRSYLSHILCLKQLKVHIIFFRFAINIATLVYSLILRTTKYIPYNCHFFLSVINMPL